jgi:hypothetical protein
MSGYVDSDGDRWNKGEYGYLGSASSSGSSRRDYEWDETRGSLSFSDTDDAFPSLFRL